MELPHEENKEEADVESTIDKTTENTEATTGSAEAATNKEQNTTDEQRQDPHTAEETVPKASQQKQDGVLNLNNEVVKMRKEVKRVRALIIRKLTRQIGALKKKKGSDADIERNRRRAARLLEEIHAIKTLVPDKVTKTALQKNLSFDKVCKDPKSSISDRATARIASHPQFSKRIDCIKAAVKMFKDERSKEEKSSTKKQKKSDKTKKQPLHADTEKDLLEAEDQTMTSIKQCETEFKATIDSSSLSLPKLKIEEKDHTSKTKQISVKEKRIPTKHVEGSTLQKKSVKKEIASKLSHTPLKSNLESESDLEMSDGDEKEYFDDSTEERFHKQSSAESEESDNDFFLGKVSKFKKKRKITEKKIKSPMKEHSSNLQIQSELEELESRLKPKNTSLNSVFCRSLARPKTGKAEGKGEKKSGGQYNSKDGASGRSQGFRNRPMGKHNSSDSKYSKPSSDKTSGKILGNAGGREDAEKYVKQKHAQGRHVFSHQEPAQPLHPSWEASKKRKAQQGQILAFQGKKIKFDD